MEANGLERYEVGGADMEDYQNRGDNLRGRQLTQADGRRYRRRPG